LEETTSELNDRLGRLVEGLEKLVANPGSNASININAGAGAIGACLGLAMISLATLCFVGGMFYSMSKSAEQSGIDNGLQDIRIRKLEQRVIDSGE